MRSHRFVLVTIAAVLIGATTVGARATIDGSGASERADPPSAPAGIGESILLVIADLVPQTDAEARLRALNEPFGEFQGFYADTTDAYEVTGLLVQTTPDVSRVDCRPYLDVFKTFVGAELVELDCPSGPKRVVDALSRVGLSYVAKPDFGSFSFPQKCGEIGVAPCQQDRVRELLGSDLTLSAGQTLLATGFRTKRGAEEFVEFARAAGVTDLVTVQVRKLAGAEVGLGQEAHPDGSGPLNAGLPDQELYQR